MPEIFAELGWAVVVFAAWVFGELLYGVWRMPRISTYAFIGFICGSSQIGILPDIGAGNVLLLANIAFGLILFEAGHRLNLRWLWANPWIAITSLIESTSTFVAVYWVAQQLSVPNTLAMLLASLAMASSPATVLRVTNELRSAGQVTERVLHLSVLNSILAVFVFKLLLGYRVLETSGSFVDASYNSLLVLSASAASGALFGIIVPAILRVLQRTRNDATVAFAISVIVLVGLTHYLKQSPVLATIAFGMVSRHRRIVLGRAERGFGVLGDVLSVLLFVSVASAIHWPLAVSGFMVGLALVLVRLAVKTGVLWVLARPSGTSLKKGALIGVALSPFSVFVILVLEQTRHLGINLIDELAPLAAAALILEIAGPVLIQIALRLAHELPDRGVS
jgi:Kef-type K+ transport system membrane component KefB